MEIFRMFGSVFVNDTASSALDSIEQKAGEADSKITSLGEKMSSFGEGLSKVGEGLITHITLPIAGATAGIIKLADKASDLSEANNVIENTFKSSATAIEAWTKTTADSAGISQTASAQWVGFMGAMLKSSGVSEQSAADMSKKLVQLTGDMSSFYNVGTSDMWEKIRSGISGETEPLKQLGINMSVANLSAFAMSQGITKAYKDMSQSEQTMLRYNYLLSVTKDAQGDFGRTLESSFANQERVAKLNLENLATSIGSKFLPSILDATKKMNEYAVALNKAFNGDDQSDKLGVTINNIANAVSRLNSDDVKNIAGIAAALASLGPGVLAIGKLTEYVGKFQSTIEKTTSGAIKFGSSGVETFKKIGTSASDMFSKFGDLSVFKKIGDGLGTLQIKSLYAMDSIKGGITSKLSPITDMVGSTFSKLGDKMPEGLKGGFGKITSLIGAESPKISAAFGDVGNKMFSGLSGLLKIGLKMFMPAVIIGALIVGLGAAQQHFGTQIDQMIQQVVTKGPKMIQDFTQGILSKIPTLMQSGTTLLINFINAIIAMAPQLIQSAVAILTALVNGLTEQIPRLIPVVINLIGVIINAIVTNLPQIIMAGLNLILALAQGISDNITQIVDTIVNVVITIIQVLSQNLPQIIEIGIKILVALIQGLAQAIPQLIAAIPQIVSAIWNGLQSINWGELGINIINGIIAGLEAAGSGIFNSLKAIASDAFEGVKDFLGIHSPSRKFRDEIGQYIPAGIAAGIEGNGDIVNEKLKNLSNGMEFNTKVNANIAVADSNTEILSLNKKITGSKSIDNKGVDQKSSDELITILNNIFELIKVIANNPAKFDMNGKTLWEALSPYAAMATIRRS